MTNDVFCTFPRECPQKTFKLVGTERVYLCVSRPFKVGNIKMEGRGWCSYQKKEGKRSYHQKRQSLKKWARKGER